MNKKVYYIYQLLKNLMPIYPMMMILFQNDGIDILQSALLLTIWSIPVVILEIPSGVMADRWSRKGMVLTGMLLQSACFAIWLIGGSFFVYATGFVLWGIGLAFCSGAEEALLFDSLKVRGEEDTFDKVLGRGRFLYGVSITIASLSGGLIAARMGMEWTLIFSVIAGLLAAVVILFFQEVNLFREQNGKKASEIHNTDMVMTASNQMNTNHPNEDRVPLKVMLKDVYLFFRNKRSLLILAVVSIAVIGTAGILDEFDSLIAKGFGMTLEAVGIWISIKYIIVALGSLLGPYLKTAITKTLHIKKILHIIGLICVVGGVLLGLTGGIRQIWTMGFFALYYLLMSACEVLAEDYLQQHIEGEGRSTVHSVISMAYNLFGILFYGVFGIVFRIGDLFSGLVVVAVYIVIMIGVFSIFEKISTNREQKP